MRYDTYTVERLTELLQKLVLIFVAGMGATAIVVGVLWLAAQLLVVWEVVR